MSGKQIESVHIVQEATLSGTLSQAGVVCGTVGGEAGLAGNMSAAYGTPGVDGGYYIPTVDEDGNLTWKASKAGMPELPGANVKGRPGDPGYTPVKGKDYFDGYTPQKGKDYFDGYTPQKGKDYFDGEPGYTPQKGKDYFTAQEVEALRDEIVDGVLFTDAEYIKGDAKAYILTDYIPNSNTRVTGKMYFNPGSSVKCMLGARNSTSRKRFDFGNNGSSKYNFGWNTAATAGTMAELPDAFEVDINRNTVYINGAEAITRADAEFACEYPLAIFGCNTEGTVGSLATAGATIYWLKVYEGDVLLHDFHPRKHLVDGYGLYDRVAKKFYPNAATSGAFTGA